jgi:putative hydrolase of the HAD superfamily
MATTGHPLTRLDVLGVLHGTVRPEMVQVLDRVIELGYKTACLTNNFNRPTEHAIESDHEREVAAIMARFDLVVESRVVGFRKPEPKFYNYACEQLGVKPSECVFLDDIGSNLKPAAAMGMSTIKVLSADQAISDLEKVLSKKLRSR